LHSAVTPDANREHPLNWYWEDSEADEDDPGMKIALEIVRGLAAA
jgi:hypothetical protein